MKATDLAWAAGLFEGEGCLTVQHTRRRDGTDGWRYPRAVLHMTDEETVRRFHHILGVGRVFGPKVNAGNRQDSWHWQTTKKAEFGIVLDRLSGHWGTRQCQQAMEVMAHAY